MRDNDNRYDIHVLCGGKGVEGTYMRISSHEVYNCG
jgi:hypothetical protein